MTFKFGMQRILELRVRHEQNSAVHLIEARSAADRARQTAEVLAEARATSAVSGRQKTGERPALVGGLQTWRYLLDRMDEQLVHAQDEVLQAEARVKERLADFSVATRDRQVLSRLKARQQEAARAAEAEADRKTMDGIALSRYVRADHSVTGGEV